MLKANPIFSWFAALAGVANATMAVAFAVSGVWLLWWGGNGIDAAGSREAFAEGMLLGGWAGTAWLMALLLGALAWLCRRTFRHARRGGGWTRGQSLWLVIELMPLILAGLIFLFEL